MKKITIIAFMSIIAFCLPFSGTAANAATPGGSQAALYASPVTVKLLPAPIFSIGLSGSYQIKNLEDGTVIPASATIAVSQEKGSVKISSGSQQALSIQGFEILEAPTSQSNIATVSAIRASGGTKPVKYRGSFTVKPGKSGPDLFNTLSMEDYLRGVVPSEMPASWEIEALKAQAVAARSYALTQLRASKSGYLEMTVASQVYGGASAENSRTDQAVRETAGIYVLYNNVPIQAYFHSSSGGYTENSENVWANAVPYIRGVKDPYDKHPANPQYGWKASASASKVAQKLNLGGNQVLLGLNVTERGVSNRVTQMEAKIYNKTLETVNSVPLIPKYFRSPDALRSAFGVSLKSTKFDVQSDSSVRIMQGDGTVASSQNLAGYHIKKGDGSVVPIADLNLSVKTLSSSEYIGTTPSSFSFTGDGWGHGLGMSQWGARGMAVQGFTFDQILKHYYTGTEVKPLN